MANKINLLFKTVIFMFLTTVSACGSTENNTSFDSVVNSSTESNSIISSTSNNKSSTEQSVSKTKDSTHLVTFDSNGGSPVEPQTIEHTYKATKPKNPTRDGYDFVNWTYQGEEWSFIGYSVTEDMTLFANWSIITYTITYNLNGGTNSINNPEQYTVEDEFPLYPASKTGHTFVAWKLSRQSIAKISKGTTGSLILEAEFSVNSHEVNVGSSDDKKGTVTGGRIYSYNSQVTVTANPNKGYSFVGWYENNSRISTDTSYSFKMPDKSVAFEARWNVITYTITYNLNGGTNSTSNPKQYTVEDEFPLYPASMTGYTFIAWKLNGHAIESISKGTTGNLTLVAEFSINSHEVVVTSSDETRGTVGGSGTFEYRSNVTVVATPKNGYSFAGWYKNDSRVSNNASYSFRMPDESVALEARWSINTYTITYTLNGGRNSSANPKQYTVEDELPLYPASKTGYTFVSWKLSDQSIESISKGTTGNITLIAEFSINSHEVVVTSSDDKKGTVSGGGTYDYNSQVTVTAAPSNGYSFAGWYKGSYKYSSSASYSFKMPDEPVGLEARWSTVTYTITYNSNGGNNPSNNPTRYTAEDEIVLESPTRFGFYFSGWLLDGNPIDRITKGTFGDIVLTASWDVTPGYENIEDFTYEITDDGIVVTGLANRSKTNIVIPSCVTSISNYAFSDDYSIESVVIPDSVTSIGYGAFSGCESLKSLTIPFVGGSQTGSGSLSYIFGYSIPSSLEEIIISDSCTSIDSSSFYGWSNVKRITIGASCVVADDSFESYDNKLSYIFETCGSLESINVSPNNPCFKSYQGILYNKDLSKLLYVPLGYHDEVILPNTITSIPNQAFYDRTSIVSITLPGSVTSIGDEAFSGCTSLESLNIPNSVTSIGRRAFPGCRYRCGIDMGSYTIIEMTCEDENSPLLYNEYNGCYYLGNDENPYLVLVKSDYFNITDCVVHDGCKFLDGYSFEFAQNLTSVSIPDSVIYVGPNSFSYCKNLNSTSYHASIDTWLSLPNKKSLKGDIHLYLDGSNEEATSITIEGVTSIDDYCFANCSSLTSIVIPNGVTTIGDCAFLNCSSLATVSIPDSVTSIGYGAFYNCSSLISVSIPNGITSISSNCFENCSSLESIVIPDSVTSIGYGAFYNCSSLESFTLPDDIELIESGAFNGCTSLAFNEYDNALYLGTEQNPYLWLISGKNSEIESCVIKNGCEFVISKAFSNCSSLTTVSIPDSVTSIGYGAFSNCSSLISVSIPNGITSISSNCFENCSSLESIVIPDSVTSISYDAFFGCSALESITIPEGVTSIDYSAFYNCTSLTTVSIPDSVTSIDQNAFSYCSSLESITIPEGVTSIGSSAFLNCTSLTTVSIPNSVTYLGSDAFAGCLSLTGNEYDNALYIGNEENPYIYLFKAKNDEIESCVINDNCLSVCSNAFYSCHSLEYVVLPPSVKYVYYGTFYYHYRTIVFYKGSRNEYYAISAYEPNPSVYFYSESEPETDDYYWHYVDGVPTIWS